MKHPESTRSFQLRASSLLVIGLTIFAGCAGDPAAYRAPVDEDAAAVEAVLRSTPLAPPEGRTPEGRLLMVGDPGAEGLIDTSGRIVVEPRFNWTRSSSEGRAMVGVAPVPGTIGEHWGFVDGTGRFVIEPKWDEASNFSEGLAAVATGIKWTVVHGLGPVGEGGKYGYVDRDGNVVIAPQFLRALPFSEGVAWVAEQEKGKWGLIDRGGKYLIEPRYRYELGNPPPFSEGLCPVEPDGGWSSDDSVARMAYIDVHGATVIPGPFQGAGSFSEGLAPIVTGRKLGFIDRAGVPVIPPRSEWGSESVNSLLTAAFSEGLAAVRIGARFGFIDKSGQVVIEPRYDPARRFSEGLAAVTLAEKTGFIDKEGRMVIAPQFVRVDPFTDGIARVEVKFSQWGYIRRDGTFLWHPLEPIEQGSSSIPAAR